MIDSLDLTGIAIRLPDQIERARRDATAVDLGAIEASRIANVVFAGMGGSGIGGDIAVAVGQPTARIPLLTVKDHVLPNFVDERTLVIATSFSGNTAETLDAVADARERKAMLVVCSAGGRLVDAATAAGAPHIALDPSIPMPRAAIGAVGTPPLVVLDRLGLIDSLEVEITQCIEHLRKRTAVHSSDTSEAARIARVIGRTFPLVYSAGPLGAVAAYRWKCQVNENAKGPAFANVLPEANHNEIAGWGQHGDITRQVITSVHLRHSYEPRRVSDSYAFVTETQEEVTAAVIEVRAQGDGRLAQLFDLVAMGDFVSLHLARQEELDPGPIPVLDELKHRLG